MEREKRLTGKRILLGVTGSIAAYKAVDILRRLQDEGALVRVVMTRNAARFVQPLTFAAISRQPVLVDEFDASREHEIGHVTASEGIDCALVAPATANILGKLAAGIADDTLLTILTACGCPLIIAPAMNERMYRNPVVQRNLRSLRELGTTIVEPEEGWLACGATGPGRLADAAHIVQAVLNRLLPADLQGTRILVTAGPTREYLDPVRFLSNPSTGKMGYALARAAKAHGAEVVLISGPTQLEPPGGVTFVSVTSAEDMLKAVRSHAEGSTALIMAAAVSDFRPAVVCDRKVKKDEASDTLQLQRTEDILRQISAGGNKPLLVGFAAETDDLRRHAHQKLKDKGLDLIVGNYVNRNGSGFGCDTNAVTIIDRNGTVEDLPLMSKAEIAEKIIEKVAQLLAK